MKKTEFKVHTIYAKEDILQMQKCTEAKRRKIGLWVLGMIFVIYAAVVIYQVTAGAERPSVIPFITGDVLDMILLIVLAGSIVFLAVLPYVQTKRILKAAPGGVLKANFYFYERTFQYGWGDAFTTIGYTEIQELRYLPNTIYIKAKDVAYWVKKSDFQVGTAEGLMEFLRNKVKCEIKE